ncbi:hypothetical protein MKO06_02705 [Gramella sp. GC03-9]|uniref:Uncharacterized protein n=1 Tax=Christiangramia oceanisediminis TaxID=2920386 RepID=A0A9X2I029_9FLAO|nr:hypothetical protein [Gramella oceanisediminis]MCP9198799.1 hypothetical protein [Gramella oceanisediminis]
MPFNKETASEAGKKSSRLGTRNKSTKEIKEAFQLLIENNLEKMEGWLDKIAKKNPEKAFDMVIKLSDFIVPKLSKQEIKHEEKELSPTERRARIAYLSEKLNNFKDRPNQEQNSRPNVEQNPRPNGKIVG